jgi:S-adenosylmethionine:tRNA ribosyltransferase-isomerase
MTDILEPEGGLSDYYYDLPAERIASFPLKNRSASQLLIYDKGRIIHGKFKELIEHIPTQTSMVFNDTRVIHSRLIFQKKSGARIEIFLLEPAHTNEAVPELLKKTDSVEWRCLVGNKRKWKEGALVRAIDGSKKELLQAEIIAEIEKDFLIRFSWSASLSFGEILDSCGHIPIPPYLHRSAVFEDRYSYQTGYARHAGAVAAPTAGLHFDEALMQDIGQAGIEKLFLTLHVGAGTFQPIKCKEIREHQMHSEAFIVPLTLIEKLAEEEKKILSVGTTSLRSLESMYWLAYKLKKEGGGEGFHLSSGYPYAYMDKKLPERRELFTFLLDYMKKRNWKEFRASTALFIYPPYRFQMSDMLISNFHLPGSTLLLLVAAFVGKNWKNIYQKALESNYRFLSYGDAMLLKP